MRQRLDAMLQAVRTIRPVVEKFYQSLNDEQKARFNALSPDNLDQQQARRNLTQVCGERASGSSLPLERIERAVQPDGGQRSALKELQDATAQAVNLLSSDCPTYRALTPGRPPAGDGGAARCDATRRANPAARARISERRAEGAVQSTQPHSGLTPVDVRDAESQGNRAAGTLSSAARTGRLPRYHGHDWSERSASPAMAANPGTYSVRPARRSPATGVVQQTQ